MPKDLPGTISPADFAAKFSAYPSQAQIDAYRSEDPKAIAAADDLTLRQAIADSLGSAQSCVAKYTQGLERANRHAREALERNGMRLVRNIGTAPNCLLEALVRHASGNYGKQLTLAQKNLISRFRAELVKHSNGKIEARDPLHARVPHLPELIKDILGKDFRFEFLRADADGEPERSHFIGDGHKTMLIFDHGGTFEALVPASDVESRKDSVDGT